MVELEADEVAVSLRYTAAAPTRPRAGLRATSTSAGQESVCPADDPAVNPGGYADDDPWFGKDANPARWGSLPGAAAEPPR